MSVNIDPTSAEHNPLEGFRYVNASEVDWDMGWGLRGECPAGGMWCCDDGLMGGGNITPTSFKEDPTGPTPQQFLPFMPYQVSGCTGGASRLPSERAIAKENADLWLDANIAGWLTQALEIGACGNPGFVDLDDATVADTDVMSTIALLIRRRRQRGMFDRATLHLPDWLALVSWENTRLSDVVNIVFGPGYGTHPLIATPNGQAWIYITGTVEYSYGAKASGAQTDDDLGLARQNRSWELAEQLAIYRFDPCAGFKALAANIPGTGSGTVPPVSGWSNSIWGSETWGP